MRSALSFIAVLGGLVIIHEYGHYLVARLLGIRAEKFSIGFGPVIFGKKLGETEFCVSLLPLGGYVKLAGESPMEAKGEKWEFQSRPLWHRSLVVLAGPLMNAFLAFVLFMIIFLVGQPIPTSKIGKVLDGTPAAKAGLLEGDRLVRIAGTEVHSWEDVLLTLRKKEGVLPLDIERSGSPMQLSVEPIYKESKSIFGKQRRTAFLGVAPANEMIYKKSGPIQACQLAARRVWDLTAMIFASLGLMISGAMPFKDSMTGPIGIFFMTKEAAQMGITYLLYFAGSLSVSLFVLNLLPIPVLDGGHLLFMLVEKIKGSPLSEKLRDKMTQGGMVLLLGLMAFVVIQDISRFSILDNFLKLFQSK